MNHQPIITRTRLSYIQLKIMKSFILSIFCFLGAASLNQAFAQCAADFDTTSSGLTINFINQSTGNYNYVEYDFGDGNYSLYVNNPSHTYSSAGIYPVCIYIIDTVNFNCIDEYCDTLFIGGATCGAFFDIESNALEVDFYDESLGTYDSLWFDFGDGNGSNDPNPTHTYAAEGTYTMCLSLYDNGSLCDSSCFTVFVTDEPCDADFSYSADGLDVDFTDESTGGYDAVYWDFGDGFGSSQLADPSYTYFAAGTYEVCLYIYNENGGLCEDEYCEFVTVTGGGGGGGGCKADYIYSADQLEFSFTNKSTGGLFSTWDFGDGSTPVFEENPVHLFASPGSYEVCVTTFNPFPFCTDTYCEFVEAKEYNCEPEFTYSFNESNAFTFVNTTSIGNITSIEWSFGDGNTSSFAQPTYTYNSAGIYNVCLTTFDNGSECGKTCEDVSVYPLGLDEVENGQITIMPNPNNGSFSLMLPQVGKSIQVQIMDLSGRILHEQIGASKSEKMDFDLNLPAGAYILQVGGASTAKPTVMKMLVQ